MSFIAKWPNNYQDFQMSHKLLSNDCDSLSDIFFSNHLNFCKRMYICTYMHIRILLHIFHDKFSKRYITNIHMYYVYISKFILPQYFNKIRTKNVIHYNFFIKIIQNGFHFSDLKKNWGFLIRGLFLKIFIHLKKNCSNIIKNKFFIITDRRKNFTWLYGFIY